MVLNRVVVPLSLLVMLGCAGTPPVHPPAPEWAFASSTPSSGKELRMRSESQYIQVSVEGDSIFGSTWNLTHAGSFIRGTGPGRMVVQVTLKEGRADGNVQNQPFSVVIKPLGDGVTEVSGLFGGILSNYKISPKIISGKIGRCSYDLTFTGTRYEGKSSCGGAINGTSMELPSLMASWTDLEVATTLALVFGT